ncbi:MAG: TRM11 family SAM-dependent methyltransferase [Streptosporangiaceae bacterium]
MERYALLIRPSANRVYSGTAVALTQAELEVFSRSVLGGRIRDIGAEVIGGVPYVTFGGDLDEAADAAFLAHLSSVYALFQVRDGLLRPFDIPSPDRLDDDLVTIQKYQGKTNEQFTRLLLNVTLLSSAFAPGLADRRFAVLDPLCGRGTTLNQALLLGFDAAGVEHDRKDFEAYAAFIKAWLKRKKIKHHADYDGPVRREGQVIGRRLQVRLAADSADYKAGRTQLLDVVSADSTRAPEFFRRATFDVVVTDAPYGIQHGSTTGGGGGQRRLARSPLDLLADAVPGWAGLLRDGGAMGIAWNTLVAPRAEAARILAGAGLEVLDDGPYRAFEHRVDQAIRRDILVAWRP